MPANTFEAANLAAILAIAANPGWTSTKVDSANGAPADPDVGLNITGAAWGVAGVALRELPGRRTAYVSVGTYDASANATVTVDGNAVITSSANHSTEDELLKRIALDVNADATVGLLVTATARDVNGKDATALGTTAVEVQLRALSAAALETSFDVSGGGSLVLDGEADADTATITVWRRTGGEAASDPEVWAPHPDYTAVSVSAGDTGALFDIIAGGYGRLYVEIEAIAKPVTDGAGITPRARTVLGAMTPSQV